MKQSSLNACHFWFKLSARLRVVFSEVFKEAFAAYARKGFTNFTPSAESAVLNVLILVGRIEEWAAVISLKSYDYLISADFKNKILLPCKHLVAMENGMYTIPTQAI